MKNWLKKQKKSISEINEMLSRAFMPTQIEMLLNPCKKSEISLRCISAKAYRYLQNTVKIPLPSISTIRRWIRNIELKSGKLDNVLNIMKSKSNSMTDM